MFELSNHSDESRGKQIKNDITQYKFTVHVDNNAKTQQKKNHSIISNTRLFSGFYVFRTTTHDFVFFFQTICTHFVYSNWTLFAAVLFRIQKSQFTFAMSMYVMFQFFFSQIFIIRNFGSNCMQTFTTNTFTMHANTPNNTLKKENIRNIMQCTYYIHTFVWWCVLLLLGRKREYTNVYHTII